MNRAENTVKEKTCRAILENRKTLSLEGIENIVSFDDSFVLLDTSDATVTVDGEGLKILKMDTGSGEVIITGRINGLVYSDKKQSERRTGGFFRFSKKQ